MSTMKHLYTEWFTELHVRVTWCISWLIKQGRVFLRLLQSTAQFDYSDVFRWSMPEYLQSLHYSETLRESPARATLLCASFISIWYLSTDNVTLKPITNSTKNVFQLANSDLQENFSFTLGTDYSNLSINQLPTTKQSLVSILFQQKLMKLLSQLCIWLLYIGLSSDFGFSRHVCKYILVLKSLSSDQIKRFESYALYM